MEFVEVGEGDLKVSPLAFESFGVRGMSTYVETDDLKMILDPGSALGPRFRLNPHEREYVALHRSRERILNVTDEGDLLTISHYHFDHYVPNFENWRFVWSSPEIAERLYAGKRILAKDTSENINTSQRKRGYMFRKGVLEYAEEIDVADRREFEYGSTKIRFSKPLYHGPENTKLGFVLVLTIETTNTKLVHAPDVQGPMYRETLEYILKQGADVLLIGGPPIYIGFKLDEADLTRARKNLAKLAENIPTVVVDHHLLRTLDYKKYLEPAISAAITTGHELFSASELISKEPELLEARRKELHKKEPIEEEWYERLEKGEIEEEFSSGV